MCKMYTTVILKQPVYIVTTALKVFKLKFNAIWKLELLIYLEKLHTIYNHSRNHAHIIIIIIIIIIVLVITVKQGIYNYSPVTNHSYKTWSVAPVLYLQLVPHVMLFRKCNMFSNFTLPLSAVCVQWTIWLLF